MRMKDRQRISRFLELVKSGAPARSYIKELGMGRDEIKYHLTLLSSYEEELAQPKFKVVVEKQNLGSLSATKEVIEDAKQKKTSLRRSKTDKRVDRDS